MGHEQVSTQEAVGGSPRRADVSRTSVRNTRPESEERGEESRRHAFLPQAFLFTHMIRKGLWAHVHKGSPWVNYHVLKNGQMRGKGELGNFQDKQ